MGQIPAVRGGSETERDAQRRATMVGLKSSCSRTIKLRG
jgi:hypothetical protein